LPVAPICLWAFHVPAVLLPVLSSEFSPLVLTVREVSSSVMITCFVVQEFHHDHSPNLICFLGLLYIIIGLTFLTAGS